MAALNKEKSENKEPISRITLVSSVFVIFLAMGALFWPSSDSAPHRAVFLVLDPSGDPARTQHLYQPLMALLEKTDRQGLRLELVTSVADFQDRAKQGASYLLCPDAVALEFSSELYAPLVAGRRAAPQNLRPQGALVYRKRPGVGVRQWQDNELRVIVGDSLSLLVKENLIQGKIVMGAVGPDPYDHSPVLHTLRLADYDYALVRHWDALRFFESGLLSDQDWAMELLGEPWPDLVVLADRGIGASRRLKTAEVLAAVGRESGEDKATVALVVDGLNRINLAGFNLLLEPDFDLVRKRSKQNWPIREN